MDNRGRCAVDGVSHEIAHMVSGAASGIGAGLGCRVATRRDEPASGRDRGRSRPRSCRSGFRTTGVSIPVNPDETRSSFRGFAPFARASSHRAAHGARCELDSAID